MAGKQPAIVAELGRPETPEETAARKAENSRKRRANQTAFNLIVATIASLGIVLFLVVVVALVVVVIDPRREAVAQAVHHADRGAHRRHRPRRSTTAA